MRPVDIQIIGNELAIKWSDAAESFISLELLRRACPCAGCKGEMDIMGNVYRNPPKPLTPAAFELRELRSVGTYALEPIWADGHNAGLFTFDLLRKLAVDPTSVPLTEPAPSQDHPHDHDHEHDHSHGRGQGHCQGRGRHHHHHHHHGHDHGGCGCGHQH